MTSGSLTVSLYGEISPAAPKSIWIDTPSSSHVLPFKWPGQDILRFSSFTFRCPEASPQRMSSSKRPKTALDEAWHSAVNLAHEADASLNDGLPSNLSSYKIETGRIHESKAETLPSTATPSPNSSKPVSGLSHNTLARQRLF